MYYISHRGNIFGPNKKASQIAAVSGCNKMKDYYQLEGKCECEVIVLNNENKVILPIKKIDIDKLVKWANCDIDCGVTGSFGVKEVKQERSETRRDLIKQINEGNKVNQNKFDQNVLKPKLQQLFHKKRVRLNFASLIYLSTKGCVGGSPFPNKITGLFIVEYLVSILQITKKANHSRTDSILNFNHLNSSPFL